MKKAGIKLQPTYKHSDYMFTSFTAPYDVMDQLNEMLDYSGCSRSSFIQALITTAYGNWKNNGNPFTRS